jgi:hypothetical protein
LVPLCPSSARARIRERAHSPSCTHLMRIRTNPCTQVVLAAKVLAADMRHPQRAQPSAHIFCSWRHGDGTRTHPATAHVSHAGTPHLLDEPPALSVRHAEAPLVRVHLPPPPSSPPPNHCYVQGGIRSAAAERARDLTVSTSIFEQLRSHQFRVCTAKSPPATRYRRS